MRQYATKEQTDRLIELGFDRPRISMPKLDWKAGVPQFRYTIGELIDMLPKNDITLEFEDGEWCVECRYCFYTGVGSELYLESN